MLQQASTRLYWQGLGNWTPNWEAAYDFGHSQRAVDTVKSHRLSGVQVAVKFSDCPFDELFAISPDWTLRLIPAKDPSSIIEQRQ